MTIPVVDCLKCVTCSRSERTCAVKERAQLAVHSAAYLLSGCPLGHDFAPLILYNGENNIYNIVRTKQDNICKNLKMSLVYMCNNNSFPSILIKYQFVEVT